MIRVCKDYCTLWRVVSQGRGIFVLCSLRTAVLRMSHKTKIPLPDGRFAPRNGFTFLRAHRALIRRKDRKERLRISRSEEDIAGEILSAVLRMSHKTKIPLPDRRFAPRNGLTFLRSGEILSVILRMSHKTKIPLPDGRFAPRNGLTFLRAQRALIRRKDRKERLRISRSEEDSAGEILSSFFQNVNSL